MRHIAALPRPDVAVDILDAWLGVAEDNVQAFREQTILEAERGDVEAALYADSARAFVATIADNLRRIRGEIVAA